jgi:flagella basal body P-ring formation protein FlgA
MIGKAVDPGALGDVISVINAQSKHTVQATVIGPGRVSVNAAGGRLAAANTANTAQ